MMRLAFFLSLFAAAPLHVQAVQPAPPAVAPEPVSPHEADLQCLAGLAAMAASDEGEIQQAGIYGTIFFMGKLLGHDRAFDLDARLGGLDMSLVTPELQRNCLVEVQTIAARMQRFGAENTR